VSTRTSSVARCPSCGSTDVAGYLWGEPAFSETLEADLAAGRVVLGGCCVAADDPSHHCNACGLDFGSSRFARSAREGTDLGVEMLAPVPLDLLLDARATFGESEFALGSRAWEVFRRLDGLAAGTPVRVWIYASHHPDQPKPSSATWTARYLRTVESVGGAHPESERYRSPLARPEDDLAYWAVYWHVDHLRELAPDERRFVSSMQGHGQPRPYGHPFEPEGPTLIEPVGI
jgi:hypothetical protein